MSKLPAAGEHCRARNIGQLREEHVKATIAEDDGLVTHRDVAESLCEEDGGAESEQDSQL